jgi:hypothetical protein
MKFDSLHKKYAKNEPPVCHDCRYRSVSNKVKCTKQRANEPIYDENRRVLESIAQELNVEIVECPDHLVDTSVVHFRCVYPGCSTVASKQFKSLKNNGLPYCQTHHYEIHNGEINSVKAVARQPVKDEYNQELDKLNEQFPGIELSWDRTTIHSHTMLSFHCVNPKCKMTVNKLYQHIRQKKGPIEVYFGCNDCKSFIGESIREGAVLIKKLLNSNN